MVKVALLIGVSDYGTGLTPLPGAVKDVEALERVLQHPEIAAFNDVKTLINPDPLVMQEAIQSLFSDHRTKDDLVLFFFSGHGIKDQKGELFFATHITRKNLQGELVKATAVPARFVQEMMSESRSKREVVILDCCFSGAFPIDWKTKDDGSVDIQNQLGGEGRAILTSSNSTQYSFEQKGLDHSIYTHYLIEGIETGAADLDNDGEILVEELHEYAKRRVREASPAMRPEIYAVKEGYKILLFNTPYPDDPKLRYRKEVERCTKHGEISIVGRKILDDLAENLGLLPEEIAAIEAEVLKPYQQYKKKLKTYEQALVDAIQREHFPLSQTTRDELKHFQQVLGLRKEDIAPIEAKVEPTMTRISKRIPNLVPFMKKPKIIIGAGVIFLIILAFYFVSNAPSMLYKQGVSKYKQGDCHGAIAYFNQALKQNPHYTDALLGRAYCLTQLEKYEEASQDIDKSIQIEPNNYKAYLIRGYINDHFGKSAQAIENYQKALELEPKNAGAYYFIAKNYASSNIPDQAIENYSKAIEIDPNYADAYYERGSVRSFKEDIPGAIADYQKAAELYEQQGNTEKSQQVRSTIEKLRESSPSTMTVEQLYDRGNTKFYEEDYKGALEDFNLVIQRNPNYAKAYYYRGYSRIQLEDYTGAIEDLSKYIQENPNDFDALYMRGDAYSKLARYEQAISDLTKAIEINPGNAYAYYARGSAYYELKKYTEAIPDYDKAIELKYDPLTLVYNDRGVAYHNLKNYQKAIDDYSKVININSTYAVTFYNRGLAYYDLEKKQEAIQDFKKAAQLYQEQGNTEKYQDTLAWIKHLEQYSNPV